MMRQETGRRIAEMSNEIAAIRHHG